jgi:hypothetical protein
MGVMAGAPTAIMDYEDTLGPGISYSRAKDRRNQCPQCSDLRLSLGCLLQTSYCKKKKTIYLVSKLP